jgi:AraC-like DNA-binding protein
MSKNHNYVLVDLATIDNWPILAAHVHYRANLLARLFKVTPRRLQREFRRQLHTTPQKVLEFERAKAIKELARKHVRTKDIRVLVEYKHDSQVCRQFHAVFGTSLKEFRDKGL